MMIKSDVSEVQAHTAKQRSQASQVGGGQSVSLDQSSTIQGNRKAKTVLETLHMISSDIQKAFENTATNLDSIAIEFDLLDKAQAQSFRDRS